MTDFLIRIGAASALALLVLALFIGGVFLFHWLAEEGKKGKRLEERRFYATAGVIIGSAIMAFALSFIYPYRFYLRNSDGRYVKGSGQAIPALSGGAFGCWWLARPS